MIKKLFSVFVLVGLLFTAAQYAAAAPAIPVLEDTYLMYGGKMKVDMKSGLTIDIKTGIQKYTQLLDVSATMYDAALLVGGMAGGAFQFGPGTVDQSGKIPYLKGDLNMMLGETPVIAGIYKVELDPKKGTPKNNKFVVDISMEPIIEQIQAAIAPLQEQIPFELVIERKKGVMTGTIAAKAVSLLGQSQIMKVATIAFNGAFTIYAGFKSEEQEFQPLLVVSLTMLSQPAVLGISEVDAAGIAGIANVGPQTSKGPDSVAQVAELIARQIEAGLRSAAR